MRLRSCATDGRRTDCGAEHYASGAISCLPAGATHPCRSRQLEESSVLTCLKNPMPPRGRIQNTIVLVSAGNRGIDQPWQHRRHRRIRRSRFAATMLVQRIAQAKSFTPALFASRMKSGRSWSALDRCGCGQRHPRIATDEAAVKCISTPSQCTRGQRVDKRRRRARGLR